MDEIIVCPNCKTTYTEQPDFCTKCRFPFMETEKEKSRFIARQIIKKGQIKEAKDSIKRARIILWLIGALNTIPVFLLFFNLRSIPMGYTIASLFVGILFVGFGFLTYKKPLLSILLALTLLIFFYVAAAISNPSTIFSGIFVKVVILSGLIYALIKIREAEKYRKENEYLSEQNYK